jgi:hypothetical protein
MRVLPSRPATGADGHSGLRGSLDAAVDGPTAACPLRLDADDQNIKGRFLDKKDILARFVEESCVSIGGAFPFVGFGVGSGSQGHA